LGNYCHCCRWKDLMTTTLLLQIAINRIERERGGGGRRSVVVGRKKLLVLVGSYCFRWEALLITALVANKIVVA
jgi:hypothetical protein